MKDLYTYITEAKRLSDLKGKQVGKIEVDDDTDNTVYVFASCNSYNYRSILLMGPGLRYMFKIKSKKLIAIRASYNFGDLVGFNPNKIDKMFCVVDDNVRVVSIRQGVFNRFDTDIYIHGKFAELRKVFPEVKFVIISDVSEAEKKFEEYCK